jgi:hypothetical protein
MEVSSIMLASKVFKFVFIALCIAIICIASVMLADVQPKEADARGGGYKYGKAIVAKARSQIGDPYGYSGGAWTCSELTGYAVRAATGVSIGYSPLGQKYYGWQPRRVRPGDVLFYDENGPAGPPTHVGIATGRGKIVHASNYFGAVVESERRYLIGYDGARRVRP